MKREFLVKSEKTDLQLVLTYESGLLIAFRVEEGTWDIDKAKILFELAQNSWFKMAGLLDTYQHKPHLLIDITSDIPFEEFWKMYPNKDTGKKWAQECWAKYSIAEKHAIMKHLKKYLNILRLNNWQSAKAVKTYLLARDWEA